MRWFSLLILLLAVSVYAQTGESFVVGSVNSNEVYAGEPIIYTLRIHLLGEVSDSQIIMPSLVGFGHSSLRIEPSAASEVFGTDLYTIVEQNYLLFPLRIGTITIEPFQVQVPETPFQSAITISTDSVTVNVRALPPEAPEGFRNAIGQYEIEASASPTELRSGDAFTFRITVSGSGNLEQILAPEITLPQGWRIFEDESSLIQDSLLFGSKSFDWTVFPIGEGAVEIPSVSFTYFNPQNEAYETRRTSPITLTLRPGVAVPVPEIPDRVAILAPQTALMPPQLALEPYPPLWFWGTWLFPPALSLAIWMLRRPRMQKSEPQAKRMSSSRALQVFRRQLKTAQTLEAKAAYELIENALNNYMSARNLDINRLPIPLKGEFASCIDEASSGRFAPIKQADVIELIRRSLAVVTAIEKEKA